MSFVYLVRSENFYKIGVANDVESRLAQLATGNPFAIYLIASFEFENAMAVETVLHQKYAGNRVRGEWFDLGVDVEKQFCSICELLGGKKSLEFETPNDEDVKNVDDEVNMDKFDFEAMFADGWRMEPAGGGERNKYWGWRKGGINRLYIYGGTLSSLPYPSLDEMRLRFDKTRK